MTKAKKKWVLWVALGLVGFGALLAVLILFLPRIVWAVIGWTFLGLLGVLVLFFVLPLTIGLRFEDGTLTVWVRVFFVRLRLLPMKPRADKPEKPKKEKKAKEEDEEEEEPGAKKKKRTFGEMWQLMKRLAAAGMAAMKRFFKHLRIRNIQLVLPVHADEASDTALRCGQVQAAIGTVRAVLDGRLRMHYKKLQIIPDFAGRYNKELFFACNVVFCPGIIFVMGVTFLVRFLRKRPYSRRVYKRAVAAKRAAAKARAQAQPPRNAA